MISTNSAKQKPTRANMRAVLRPALVALSASVRGLARLTIPMRSEAIAHRNVPTITKLNQWLNMAAKLRGKLGLVNA